MEQNHYKLPKKQSQLKEAWHTFTCNKPACVGLVFVIILFIIAFSAEKIVPFQKAIEMSVADRLAPPSKEHIFGMDALGRDMFARVIHGAKVSLTMGFAPTIIAMLIGMFFGACAAYFGKWVDAVIMRICDIFACIPGLLMSLTFVAVLGPGLKNMLIAITISSIPGCTRYVRAMIMNIVEADYIEAAKCCGTSSMMIMYKHVLPNAVGPLVYCVASDIAGMIMTGAGLSFLGLGMQPPNPEWGYMLADAREYMRRAPFLLASPGFAILISILSFNLVGDGIRDAVDPKLRR